MNASSNPPDTPDPLAELSHGDDRQAFATALVETEVMLLTRTDDVDPEEDVESFEPLCYERDGKLCMPIFSSQILAQQFVDEFVEAVDQDMEFNLVTMEGGVVAGGFDAFDVIVLNDLTEQQYVLTPQDRKLIAVALG